MLLTQRLLVPTLQDLRQSWRQACIDWQAVSFIDFGPALDISLKSQTNIFPTDTALIKSNISSGTYDLQTPSNFDAKGVSSDRLFIIWNR